MLLNYLTILLINVKYFKICSQDDYFLYGRERKEK